MKPVQVQLRPPVPVKRTARIACFILISTAAASSFFVFQRERQLLALQREVLTSRFAQQPVPADVGLPSSAVGVRAALAEHQIPWPGALEVLESADTAGATVLLIEYIASARLVSVDISLESPSVVSDYLDALNQESPMWLWAPVSSSHPMAGNGTARIEGRMNRR
jgi:hypothetical protein